MGTGVGVTADTVAGSSRGAGRAARERWFFSGMAIASAAAIFWGFAASYFLKSVYGTPPLSSLLHLHGILFTSWMVLLLAQTSLVAARRTDGHRRLGVVATEPPAGRTQAAA